MVTTAQKQVGSAWLPPGRGGEAQLMLWQLIDETPLMFTHVWLAVRKWGTCPL